MAVATKDRPKGQTAYHIIHHKYDHDTRKPTHEFQEVRGRRITVPGYEDFHLFAHGRTGNWRVSEAKTGFWIGVDGGTLEEVIKGAKAKLDQIGGPDAFKGHIKSALDSYGATPSHAKAAVAKPKADPKPAKPTKEPWEMTSKADLQELKRLADAGKVEPWQVTRRQVEDFGELRGLSGEATQRQLGSHERDVKAALAAGKPVPEAVLKDYPELGKRKAEYTPVEQLPDAEIVRLWKIPEQRDMPQDYKDYLARARAEFNKRDIKLKPMISAKPTNEGKISVKPLPQEGFIISRGNMIPIAYEIGGKKYKASAVLAPTKGKLVETHNDIYFGHYKVGTGKEITKAHIDKGIGLAKAFTLPETPTKTKEESKKPKPKAERPPTMPRGEALKLIAEVQAGRTRQARVADKSFKAQTVLPVEKAGRWAKAPHRFDIKGVDTPCAVKRPLIPGIAYADKGKQRLSRQKHKGFRKIKTT